MKCYQSAQKEPSLHPRSLYETGLPPGGSAAGIKREQHRKVAPHNTVL
jgi:hypothetical protein